MRRAAVLVAVAGALVLPASAAAHATLRRAEPGYRQRLAAPPRAVVLHFDQSVAPLPRSIVVLTPRGPVRTPPARADASSRTLRVALPRLRAGAYTVRWHALAGDGHVVSGVYTFGVRVDAPPPTEAVGASGPTRSEDIVRWGYFLALALLLGGVGFRLLVAPRQLPPRVERRFYVLAGIGAVAVLELGILAFVLRARDALQLPFARLLYGDLSPVASGTRFGVAFIAMTLGFALTTALLFLAWLTERRALLWGTLAVGLGFASGLSLSGHSAADAGSSWRSAGADWVHLAAASLWIGGLVQLAFCVWPLAPELRRDAFLRFSRLATVLIALVLSAGVYLSILRLPHVADLWQESYGRILLVKLSLVAVALAWGGVHHFVARPALERGEAGMLARLPRSLVGESVVGMVVLLAAAILVDSKPPPSPQATAPQQAASVRR